MSKERRIDYHNKPFTEARIAQTYQDNIREAVSKGADLSQVTTQLNQLFGTNFDDPRQFSYSMFRDLVHNSITSLDLDFESFTALADSLFSQALAYIQKNDRYKSLPFDDRSLLAAYTSVEDWQYLYRLLHRPSLFVPGHENEIRWPVINPVYLNMPSRPIRNTSRKYGEYVRPTNDTIPNRVQSIIDTANGEKIHITDIGMGEGTVVSSLAKDFGNKVEITGITMGNVSAKDVRVLTIPAEFLTDIPDNSQEVLLSNFASCYFLWPERAYKEMIRILKPGYSAYIDAAEYLRLDAFEDYYQYFAFVLGDTSRDAVISRLNWQYRPLRMYGDWKGYFLTHLGPSMEENLLVEPAQRGDSYGTAIKLTKLK